MVTKEECFRRSCVAGLRMLVRELWRATKKMRIKTEKIRFDADKTVGRQVIYHLINRTDILN
jgi:hypothetical protein